MFPLLDWIDRRENDASWTATIWTRKLLKLRNYIEDKVHLNDLMNPCLYERLLEGQKQFCLFFGDNVGLEHFFGKNCDFEYGN
jgi:hypothetical protein